MAARLIDRSFKIFADRDMQGLAYLFAGVPLDAPLEIERIDHDLALPGLLADNALLVRGHGGIPRDRARYARALDLKYELPIDSTVVVLTPRGVPRGGALPPSTPFRCCPGRC